MGLAMDMQAGYAITPGATITALTSSPNDSFVVKSFAPSATAYLEQLIRSGGETGIIRVRSPLMHDFVQGIRFSCPSGSTDNLLHQSMHQPLYTQDALAVEVTGGTSASDVGVIGIYYTDLGGASARLVMPGDISGRVRNIVAVEVDVTSSATIGTWTDTVITTTEDVLHANTDYAVLGYILSGPLAAIALRGPDTSNLRCGGPGGANIYSSSSYFLELSLDTGFPHIPVINSANKGGTYVSCVHHVGSTSSAVTLVMAELRPA
jgi:hypothetical protein